MRLQKVYRDYLKYIVSDKWEKREVWGKQVMWLGLGTHHLPLTLNIIVIGIITIYIVIVVVVVDIIIFVIVIVAINVIIVSVIVILIIKRMEIFWKWL